MTSFEEPFNFEIPQMEPLSAYDWIFLVFMFLFGLMATIMGGYFSYMNEHGKSLIFKAIVEKGFPAEVKKKQPRECNRLREMVTELSRAETEATTREATPAPASERVKTSSSCTSLLLEER